MGTGENCHLDVQFISFPGEFGWHVGNKNAGTEGEQSLFYFKVQRDIELHDRNPGHEKKWYNSVLFSHTQKIHKWLNAY